MRSFHQVGLREKPAYRKRVLCRDKKVLGSSSTVHVARVPVGPLILSPCDTLIPPFINCCKINPNELVFSPFLLYGAVRKRVATTTAREGGVH